MSSSTGNTGKGPSDSDNSDKTSSKVPTGAWVSPRGQNNDGNPNEDSDVSISPDKLQKLLQDLDVDPDFVMLDKIDEEPPVLPSLDEAGITSTSGNEATGSGAVASDKGKTGTGTAKAPPMKRGPKITKNVTSSLNSTAKNNNKSKTNLSPVVGPRTVNSVTTRSTGKTDNLSSEKTDAGIDNGGKGLNEPNEYLSLSKEVICRHIENLRKEKAEEQAQLKKESLNQRQRIANNILNSSPKKLETIAKNQIIGNLGTTSLKSKWEVERLLTDDSPLGKDSLLSARKGGNMAPPVLRKGLGRASAITSLKPPETFVIGSDSPIDDQVIGANNLYSDFTRGARGTDDGSQSPKFKVEGKIGDPRFDHQNQRQQRERPQPGGLFSADDVKQLLGEFTNIVKNLGTNGGRSEYIVKKDALDKQPSLNAFDFSLTGHSTTSDVELLQ